MRYLPISLSLLFSVALAGCSTTSGAIRAPSEEEGRLIGLAQDIERRGDSETAASLYEQAAQVSNDPLGAYVRLGQTQLAAGDLEKATESFRTALEVSPQNGDALLGLGTAQLRTQQVETSARTLSAAAPIVNTPTAYNRLGTALILAGDGQGAEAAFARALSLEPGNLDTMSNLGLAQALSGQTDTANATLQAVTQSPLAEERHYRNLMLVLTLGGRDQEAAGVVVPDYSDSEKQAFLAEARRVRSINGASERAMAIGLLSSG